MDDRENLGHLSLLEQITSNGSFLSSGMRREQCSSTSAYLANASQGARRRQREGASVWRRRDRHRRALPTGGGRRPSPARGCARGRAPLTASRRTRAICGPAYRRCSRSCRLRDTRGRCGPPCRSCSTTSGSGRSPVPRSRGCRPSESRHACRRRRRRRRRGLLGFRGYRSHRRLHRRSGTSCRTSRRRHSRRCPGCRSRRAGLPAGIHGRSGPSCGTRSTPGYSWSTTKVANRSELERRGEETGHVDRLRRKEWNKEGVCARLPTHVVLCTRHPARAAHSTQACTCRLSWHGASGQTVCAQPCSRRLATLPNTVLLPSTRVRRCALMKRAMPRCLERVPS
ncbi:unnamed protein product [Ixodes persulcatus]